MPVVSLFPLTNSSPSAIQNKRGKYHKILIIQTKEGVEMKKAMSILVALSMTMAIVSVAWSEGDEFINLTQIIDLLEKWKKIGNFSYPKPEAPLFSVLKRQNPENKMEKAFVVYVFHSPNWDFYIHSFHRVYYKEKGKSFLESYYPSDSPVIFSKFHFYENRKDKNCGKCHNVPIGPDSPSDEEPESESPITPVSKPPPGQALSMACFSSHFK